MTEEEFRIAMDYFMLYYGGILDRYTITVPLEVGEKIALSDPSGKSITKYLGTIEPDEEDHEGMVQGYDGKWRWL